ncbi:MAG: HAMP domain-containing histidine kinase [Armatimonadetes bacterium]|nr:HAMP domain-containing histidine kinase [Armatimonadota bacterium]
MGELDRMCQQLLSFARDASTMVTETLQVSEFLEGLAAAAAPSFRAGGVTFEWQCDGDGSVEAAGAELFRAALDVLEAASEAARPGGTVTLAAACQPEGFGLAVAGSAADPHACWRELDEAGALAAGGSELSLAVARRVVQRHGGCVALQTRGEQYTLHLLIPLRPQLRPASTIRDTLFAAA